MPQMRPSVGTYYLSSVGAAIARDEGHDDEHEPDKQSNVNEAAQRVGRAEPQGHNTRRTTPTSSSTFPSLRLSMTFKPGAPLDENQDDQHDQYDTENCK